MDHNDGKAHMFFSINNKLLLQSREVLSGRDNLFWIVGGSGSGKRQPFVRRFRLDSIFLSMTWMPMKRAETRLK